MTRSTASSPHFTTSKLRFWYQKKAHIFLIIPVKFEAWEMFPVEVMNKNVNKRWLPPKTAHTILWAILVHIFVYTIHTAGSIQLKICNWVFLVICFHVREKASYENSESRSGHLPLISEQKNNFFSIWSKRVTIRPEFSTKFSRLLFSQFLSRSLDKTALFHNVHKINCRIKQVGI